MITRIYQYLFLFLGAIIVSTLLMGGAYTNTSYTNTSNLQNTTTSSGNISNNTPNITYKSQFLQSNNSGTQLEGWNFANPDRWIMVNPVQQKIPISIDGGPMLESVYQSTVGGIHFETAEYQKVAFSNGSITAAVYSTNPYEFTGIVLRGGDQSSTPCNTGIGSTTLCQGYLFRFYLNKVFLAKFTSISDDIEFGNYTLPGGVNFSNQWWYIKLQANGSKIQAWVSKTPSFTVSPQLSASDTSYTYGYAGIVARTQNTDPMVVQSYDDVHITLFNPIEQNESFNGSIIGAQNDGWVFVNPSRWKATSNISGIPNGTYILQDQNNAGSSGVTYDSIQLQTMSIINGSIEGWFYTTNQYKTLAIWIRTGAQTPGETLCSIGSNNPSYICSGYVLLLYNDSTQLVAANNKQGILLQKYFTGYITNTWWHIKLQAIGTTISAWVTTSSTFSSSSTMTVNDSTYSSGYAALSARTNFVAAGSYYDYFDAINVSIYSINGIVSSASGVTSISSYVNSQNTGNTVSFMITLIMVLVFITSLGLVIGFVIYSRDRNSSTRYINSHLSTSITGKTISSSENIYSHSSVFQTSSSQYAINTPKTCIRCGQPVNTEDVYCFHCGQKQV